MQQVFRSIHPLRWLMSLALSTPMLLVLVALVAATNPALAQTTVVPVKDSRGLDVAEAALAALGGSPDTWDYQDSVTTGHFMRAGSDSTSYAVTLKSKGMNLFRSEMRVPGGMSLLVRRDGHSVLRFSDGTTRELRMVNDLSRRVDHIPALSLLAERRNPEVAIDAPGQVQLSDRVADTIVMHIETDRYGLPDFVRRASRRVFTIDPTTGLVSSVEFDNRPENGIDSEATWKTQVRYSDYRLVDGIWIPFRQSMYADGRLQSELVLDSVQFNVGLSDAEFVFPQ